MTDEPTRESEPPSEDPAPEEPLPSRPDPIIFKEIEMNDPTKPDLVIWYEPDGEGED